MNGRKSLAIAATAGVESFVFQFGQGLGWTSLVAVAVLIAAIQEFLRTMSETGSRQGFVLAGPILKKQGKREFSMNMNEYVVVDITRANDGTERRVVENVVERHRGQNTRIIVVGYDVQRTKLGAVLSAVEFRALTGWQPEAEIVRQLASVVSAALAAGAKQLTLFSFHHAVLNKQGELAVFDYRLDTRALKGYTFSATADATEWPEDLMPATEAVEIAVQALVQAGATADRPLLKTDLRPLLIRLDSRFQKSAHPVAAKPGFISILLEKARSAKRVEMAGAEPKVVVWLAGAHNAGTLQPDAPSTTGTPVAGMGDPGSILSSPATEAMPAPPDGVLSTGAEQHEFEKAKRDKIYNEFVAALRQTKFGPFAAVREELFAALLEFSKDPSDMLTAGELVARAVEKVRDSEQTPEVQKQYKDGTWKQLLDFGLRVLARAGFLLDSAGKPLSSHNQFRLPLSVVQRPLPNDLAFRLEAEMVAEALRTIPVIWEYRELLAGALYGHHGHNGQAKNHVTQLEEIFTFLLDQEKAEFDPVSGELRGSTSEQESAGDSSYGGDDG